jgi:thioredoxin-like negative regulator of GroEL
VNVALADDAAVRAALGAPGPVLLIYTARWCRPCAGLADEAAAAAAWFDGLRVAAVDLDDCPASATVALLAAGVRAVPLLGLYRDGQVLGWKMGTATRAGLREWLTDQLRAG